MAVNAKKTGSIIGTLRRGKGLTQENLGERLNISAQAVSKWERGEALPDIALLPDLSAILETSVDNILSGGEPAVAYRGKISVQNVRKGIESIIEAGRLLGRDNLIYRYAVDGINRGMNTDFELCIGDEGMVECFMAEAIIQEIKNGGYADVTEIKNSFKSERYKKILLEFACRYGIK